MQVLGNNNGSGLHGRNTVECIDSTEDKTGKKEDQNVVLDSCVPARHVTGDMYK